MKRHLLHYIVYTSILALASLLFVDCGSTEECQWRSIEINGRTDLKDHGPGTQVMGALRTFTDCANGQCLDLVLGQELKAKPEENLPKDSVTWVLRGPDGKERHRLVNASFSYRPREAGTWLLMVTACGTEHQYYIRVGNGAGLRPDGSAASLHDPKVEKTIPPTEQTGNSSIGNQIITNPITDSRKIPPPPPPSPSQAAISKPFKTSPRVPTDPDLSSADWTEDAEIQLTAIRSLQLNSFNLWVQLDDEGSASISLQVSPPGDRINLTPAKSGVFKVPLNSFNLDMNKGDKVSIKVTTEGCQLLALPPLESSASVPVRMEVLRGRNVLGEISGN